MIFNMNESAMCFEDEMESVVNRFQNESMMEATMIVLGEQEENWTRFMKAVGLDELRTLQEGGIEAINEENVLKSMWKKVVEFFESIIKKIKELTRKFVDALKERQFNNDKLCKKYKDIVNEYTSGAEIENYKPFSGLDTKFTYGDIAVSTNNLAGVTNLTSLDAKRKVSGLANLKETDSLAKEFKKSLTGEKAEKATQITSGMVKASYYRLEGGKANIKRAQESYYDAKDHVDKIIKDVKKMEKDADKDSTIKKHSNAILSYWKAAGNAISACHGTLLSALAERQAQDKSIIVKAAAKTAKKDKKAVKEGFVNTESFLGAVEFI